MKVNASFVTKNGPGACTRAAFCGNNKCYFVKVMIITLVPTTQSIPVPSAAVNVNCLSAGAATVSTNWAVIVELVVDEQPVPTYVKAVVAPAAIVIVLSSDHVMGVVSVLVQAPVVETATKVVSESVIVYAGDGAVGVAPLQLTVAQFQVPSFAVLFSDPQPTNATAKIATKRILEKVFTCPPVF